MGAGETVSIPRKDAIALARFAISNAGNGLKGETKQAGLRVADILDLEDKIMPCAEPHHHTQPVSEKAHRMHHWRERLVCMSACLALHLFLEFGEKYIW